MVKANTMNKHIASIIAGICFIASSSASAQSPGGVTGVTLWMRADNSARLSTTIQGASVASWQNNGGTITFQNAVVAKQPVYTNLATDNYNYNPSIKFTRTAINNGQYLKTSQAYTSTTFCNVTSGVKQNAGGSEFAVAGMTNAGDGGDLITQWNAGADYTFYIAARNGGLFASIPKDLTGGTPMTGLSVITNAANIMEADKPVNTTTTVTGRMNGKKGTSTINTGSWNVPASDSVYIGINSPQAPAAYWNGNAAEFITYNSQVTGANMVKIQSYLAIKYGLTLDSAGNAADRGAQAAYLNTAGTVIYQGGGAGSKYWNNIIGIGREVTAEALHQKQSRQLDDSVRLYLGSSVAASNIANTNNLTSDGDYVLMGSNTGKLCTDAATANEIPTAFINSGGIRIDKEWKIMSTNYTGNYNADITLSCNFGNGGSLLLLVDDDGDFTNAQIISPPSISITFDAVSKRATINNLNNTLLNNGTPATSLTKYITLATVLQVLPVTMLSFNAIENNGEVQLNWSTASESNSSHFELQRSKDAMDWKNITSVEAKGYSSNTTKYSYTDNTPEDYLNYYRVKQVDKDGKYTFSVILKIVIKKADGMYAVYPNPAQNNVFIEWKGGVQNKPKQISVYNYNGSIMYVPYIIGQNKAVLNIMELAQSCYFIKLEINNQIVQKLLVKH